MSRTHIPDTELSIDADGKPVTTEMLDLLIHRLHRIVAADNYTPRSVAIESRTNPSRIELSGLKDDQEGAYRETHNGYRWSNRSTLPPGAVLLTLRTPFIGHVALIYNAAE